MNKNTMRKVKRVTPMLYREDDESGLDISMELTENGNYVLYTDYKILEDKLKELTKENNDLKDNCYLTGGYD